MPVILRSQFVTVRTSSQAARMPPHLQPPRSVNPHHVSSEFSPYSHSLRSCDLPVRHLPFRERLLTFPPAIIFSSSILTESSRSAIAAVLYPSLCSTSIAPSGQHAFLSKYVHGIWNTVPMLTRLALRYSGSAQADVKRTASIPSAAAERKIAPTFVGFTTFSKIATRLAFAELLHGRQCGTVHGTEHAACQL